MAQTLLIEYSVFTPKNTQITEGISGNKNMIVNGIVQRAEEFNHNGRRYPFEILKREVDKYIEGPIKENRALGELDHPESSVINLKNASHNIKELYFEGNDLMGSIEILPTPSGNILKELFKSGIKLGISSRGMGSVKEVMREGNNTLEVQPDFELVAFDFVSNPSTHGAFLSPVNESVNKVVNKRYSNINNLITTIIREF